MQHKREYIWNLFGNLGSQILYLFINLILARILTPYEFGTIGVITIFLTLSDVIIDSGLGGSLVKEKNISQIDCSTIFWFNLFTSSLLYIIIFISAPVIEHYFQINGLQSILRLICLVFFSNSMRIVPASILVKKLNFRIISIINLLSVVFAGVIAILSANLNFGVYSLVLYTLSRSIFIAIGYFIYTHYSISLHFSIDSFNRLISFGAFTTLTLIIDTIYENLITILFGRYLSVSAAGYLSQAKRLEEAGTRTLTTSINAVAFPALVKLKDDKNTFIRESDILFKTITVITIPLILTMCIFSKPIILLLYGQEWEESTSYLSILLVAGIFIILENITRISIKSTGYANKLFFITMFKRIIAISIIISTIFISIKYLLWSYVIGSIIGYLCNVWQYSQLISIKFSRLLLRHFQILFPSIIYYFISYSASVIFNSIYLSIIICVILLLIYYFIIDKFLKLNLLYTIANLFKFHKS